MQALKLSMIGVFVKTIIGWEKEEEGCREGAPTQEDWAGL